MKAEDNPSKSRTHLLDTICAIRASVGEGLDDNELTRLLRENTLLSEAGFTFVSFSEGFVTLNVPEQDLANWYPKEGWITAEKEESARAIAEKYGLSLHEPVDTVTSSYFPPSTRPATHHHLELCDGRQTVVVAHPRYLKVRLLGVSEHHRYTWEAMRPLALGPNLLQDLAALYSNKADANFEHPSN